MLRAEAPHSCLSNVHENNKVAFKVYAFTPSTFVVLIAPSLSGHLKDRMRYLDMFRVDRVVKAKLNIYFI